MCDEWQVHSRTPNGAEICREADVVIAACGKAEMLGSDWIKDGAVVIDVGINAVDVNPPPSPNTHTRARARTHARTRMHTVDAFTHPVFFDPHRLCCDAGRQHKTWLQTRRGRQLRRGQRKSFPHHTCPGRCAAEGSLAC